MERYSEQDLKYAAAFREEIHREALGRLRATRPEIDAVVDRWGVEDYFQRHWDYPGKWYDIVAIPSAYRSRDALIDDIVADTLARYGEPSEKRSGGEEREDEGEHPRRAAVGDEALSALLERYERCVVEYAVVPDETAQEGLESHRRALARACETLCAGWTYDVDAAHAVPLDAASLFAEAREGEALNYRGAFLHPPHESGYADADFDRVNAALFPNGTEALEAYEWTTDWSDYFDEGHEWWGALCLTVYDKSLRRFAVIVASATD